MRIIDDRLRQLRSPKQIEHTGVGGRLTTQRYVECGPVAADRYSTSLIDRVRVASKKTLWQRIVFWGGMALAASAVAGSYFTPGSESQREAVLACSSIIGVSAGLGVTVFCFTRFILSKTFNHLLAAAAFSTLGAGFAAQAIVDFRGLSPVSYGWITSSAWLISSLMFLGSAYAEATWQATGRLMKATRLLGAGLIVAAFPVTAVPYALDLGPLRYLVPQRGSPYRADLIELVGLALAPALVTAALIGFYRRYQNKDDRIAGLLCYFFVACLLGLLSGAASNFRFDEFWTVSQLLLAAGWLALAGGIGVENAIAHKEVSDHIEEMEALHQVSWALVGAGSLRELLDLFALTVKERLGASIAAVYLGEDGGESLELAAISGPEECVKPVGAKYPLRASGTRPGFHSGHTAEAFRSKETRIAQDVFIDVEFVPWRVIARDTGCAASLPLIDRGESVGVLNLYLTDARQMTPQRLKLLATIASATAPAIQNARAREAQEVSEESKRLDLAA